MEQNYPLLADLVLLLHALIVLFIVMGLLLILVGAVRGWQWISNPIFRIAHLFGIVIVVLQAWMGRLCPLTILEAWLRGEGDGGAAQQSFIQYWLQRILFYEFPLWMFAVAYTLFGFLVLVAWIRYPPKFR